MEAGESLAYIAGFFDGEGSIGIHKSQGLYATLWVSISNTNREVIDYICYCLPSEVYAYPRSRNGKIYRLCHTIQWNSQDAVNVLELILPHLIVKREIAEVALDFWYNCYRNSQGVVVSEAEIILRKSYKDKISDLNHGR